jgi:hypothetical protein
MFMISTMMGYIISMHLYYESGAAAVAVDHLQVVVVWTEREEEAADDDEWRA